LRRNLKKTRRSLFFLLPLQEKVAIGGLRPAVPFSFSTPMLCIGYALSVPDEGFIST
jgi:hypothetical protein